eukprot:TRINITY_DN42646_c0_g1_i1.p1 TRINITY_DN42646_c0_g1~~TRINITY_DN42646_c0_g1_i1.p1  ORF type:complete len:321 (+),score=48.58 TRINITY_DN42646_c0_g1_i1:60-1022(+)
MLLLSERPLLDSLNIAAPRCYHEAKFDLSRHRFAKYLKKFENLDSRLLEVLDRRRLRQNSIASKLEPNMSAESLPIEGISQGASQHYPGTHSMDVASQELPSGLGNSGIQEQDHLAQNTLLRLLQQEPAETKSPYQTEQAKGKGKHRDRKESSNKKWKQHAKSSKPASNYDRNHSAHQQHAYPWQPEMVEDMQQPMLQPHYNPVNYAAGTYVGWDQQLPVMQIPRGQQTHQHLHLHHTENMSGNTRLQQGSASSTEHQLMPSTQGGMTYQQHSGQPSEASDIDQMLLHSLLQNRLELTSFEPVEFGAGENHEALDMEDMQ